MAQGAVALREVRERFRDLDLDRRRTVIRALCQVTVSRRNWACGQPARPPVGGSGSRR